MRLKSILSTLAFICAGLVFTAPVFAISETNNYQEEYKNKVLPFYESCEKGFFNGVDNKKVFYVKYEVENEKGAIVIVPGWCDSLLRFIEVVYDLKDMGYSFYLIDNRGYGFSERLLPDPQMNYVDNFNDYIDDLKYFFDNIVNARSHQKRFAIGHSMGGAIVTRYIQRYQYDFNAAILSSPMMKVNTGNIPEVLAYSVGLIGSGIGFKTKYAPGRGPAAPEEFEDSSTTQSRERWTMFYKNIVNMYPELYTSCVVSGDTIGFSKELLESTYELQLNVRRVNIPVLLLQAEKDSYVEPMGQNAFAAHAKNCTKIVVPNARHSLLFEIDSIRNFVIDHIVDFIEEHE